MYKFLLRPPLGQTLLLLWVVGLVQVTLWLLQARPPAALTGPALLGAALSVLISARLRRPSVLVAAVLLGLAAFFSIAARIESIGPVTWATLTALYGLALWRLVVSTLRLRATDRVVAVLGLSGGYRRPGGRVAVESITHWSSFTLAGLALAGFALEHGARAIPPAPLPALALSLAFLWLAGRRYGLRLHSYLLIGLGLWGVLGVYAGLSAPGTRRAGITLDHAGLGLVLACYGLAAWALGQRIAARASVAEIETTAGDLYSRPLQVFAEIVACLAAAQAVVTALAGVLVPPGWPAMAACGMAALTLLLPDQSRPHPALRLLGVGLATLALVWLFSASIHHTLPFGLWPGGPATGDEWLVLALLALGLASSVQVLMRHPRWDPLYAPPLWIGAALTYGWTLAAALAMLSHQDTAYLTPVAAVLIAGLFPLLRPLGEKAPSVRGVGLALLATLLVMSLLGPSILERWGSLAGVAWGYALWATGNLLLPRFNARFPRSAAAPDAWPWLGLLSLGLGLVLTGPSAAMRSGYVLATAGYLFLMLRNSAWPGFLWGAVLALTWVGVAFSLARPLDGIFAWRVNAAGGAAIEMLLWANGLLLGVPLWRRYGKTLAGWLGWRNSALQPPLLPAAFALCGLWLFLLGVWDLAVIPELAPPEASVMVVGILLSLSLFHGLLWWRSQAAAQLLLLGVLCTVLAAWETWQPFHLSLLLALWAAALLVAAAAFPATATGLRSLLGQALEPWYGTIPLAALAALVLEPGISVPERLLTVAVLSGTAARLGWHRRDRAWLYGTALLVLVLAHGVWFIWIPVGQALALLPWVSLELALLTCAVRWLVPRLGRDLGARGEALTLVAQTLAQVTPWVAGLAVAEWVLQLGSFVYTLGERSGGQGLVGVWDSIASLFAVALLTTLGVAEARRRAHVVWVYGIALLAGLGLVYVRLLWAGLAPLSVWDTAAIMAAAYALFILQRLTLSGPILHLAMLLPLLALLTVPLQLGSGHAGLTLLAAGTLYLLTRRATGMRTPLYLGLLAVNAALYLWIPDLARRYGLLQVYLVPATVSVLVLLHLHRREIKPSVLNGARLAALSTLYAAATLDVFLRQELAVFVLALGLSLSSIVVGIGTRTRAFLYVGVAFLVLNVLGQLIQLYPEQRLGRALALMALGATITALMVWFSMKREAVLQRIRVFRADLESWD